MSEPFSGRETALPRTQTPAGTDGRTGCIQDSSFPELNLFKGSSMHRLIRIWCLLLLGLSTTVPILSTPLPQQTEVQDPYRSGIRALQAGEYSTAERLFNSMLSQDKRSAAAYYGLGRVALAREPGSDQPVEYLKRATGLDPHLWEAWFYLASAYRQRNTETANYDTEAEQALQYLIQQQPDYINAWLLLAAIREDNERWESAVNTLGRALRRYPARATLYHRFVYLAFRYDRQQDALPILQEMIQATPDSVNRWLDLARCQYQLGQYRASQTVLDSMEDRFSRLPVSTVALLRAKIDFRLDQETRGLQSYFTAMNNIRDSLRAAEFFRDLQYLATDSEYAEYLRTPVDRLPYFFRAFWMARDPDLATEINERIPEHYRRLRYARTNYRRYVDDCSYFYDHAASESSRLLKSLPVHGDELLDPSLSGALAKGRDLDDAGLIYVRHGEPDVQATGLRVLPLEIQPQDKNSYDPTDIPQNISWKYEGNAGRRALIFHFVRYSGKCGWLMESLPFTFSNRHDLNATYGEIENLLSDNSPYANKSTSRSSSMDSLGISGPGSPVDPVDSDLQTRVFQLTREAMDQDLADAAAGLETETSEYQFPEQPMSFPLAFVNFKGRGGNCLVDWFYLIPGAETQLAGDGPTRGLRLEKFVGLFSEQWNEIVRSHVTDTKPIPLSQEEWQSKHLAVGEEFHVPPGRYHYAIHIKDRTSGRIGKQRGDLVVPDFYRDSLMLSDVLVSGAIQPASASAAFRKGDFAFQPHMFADFAPGETVGIYFEIYNLTPDGVGHTSFQVSTQLRSGESGGRSRGLLSRLFGGGSGEVTTSQEYSGHSPDDHVFLNFDLSAYQPGSYQLEIRVQDLQSNAESARSVPLRIAARE